MMEIKDELNANAERDRKEKMDAEMRLREEKRIEEERLRRQEREQSERRLKEEARAGRTSCDVGWHLSAGGAEVMWAGTCPQVVQR